MTSPTNDQDSANILKALAKAYREKSHHRPWVTLTWAQSLDGKLSTSSTDQTVISGPHSMQLTHALRATHHSILVGSNTLLVDDPRLTTRLSSATESLLQSILPLFSDKGLDTSSNVTECSSPVPVILDSRLRTPLTARCLQQKRNNPHKPFIFCSSQLSPTSSNSTLDDIVNIIPVPVDTATSQNAPYLSLSNVLDQLGKHDIKSVMVEGGTSVLSSFFAEGLWDMVIVTIAPAIFGAGPALQAPHHKPLCFANLRLARTEWYQFGDDAVLIAFPK